MVEREKPLTEKDFEKAILKAVEDATKYIRRDYTAAHSGYVQENVARSHAAEYVRSCISEAVQSRETIEKLAEKYRGSLEVTLKKYQDDPRYIEINRSVDQGFRQGVRQKMQAGLSEMEKLLRDQGVTQQTIETLSKVIMTNEKLAYFWTYNHERIFSQKN